MDPAAVEAAITPRTRRSSRSTLRRTRANGRERERSPTRHEMPAARGVVRGARCAQGGGRSGPGRDGVLARSSEQADHDRRGRRRHDLVASEGERSERALRAGRAAPVGGRARPDRLRLPLDDVRAAIGVGQPEKVDRDPRRAAAVAGVLARAPRRAATGSSVPCVGRRGSRRRGSHDRDAARRTSTARRASRAREREVGSAARPGSTSRGHARRAARATGSCSSRGGPRARAVRRSRPRASSSGRPACVAEAQVDAPWLA